MIRLLLSVLFSFYIIYILYVYIYIHIIYITNISMNTVCHTLVPVMVQWSTIHNIHLCCRQMMWSLRVDFLMDHSGAMIVMGMNLARMRPRTLWPVTLGCTICTHDYPWSCINWIDETYYTYGFDSCNTWYHYSWGNGNREEVWWWHAWETF